VFNPSSKVYNYTFVELKSNGENEVCIVTHFVVLWVSSVSWFWSDHCYCTWRLSLICKILSYIRKWYYCLVMDALVLIMLDTCKYRKYQWCEKTK